jgi:dTDP-4-dehydrorhamnose 3,5-epimerase
MGIPRLCGRCVHGDNAQCSINIRTGGVEGKDRIGYYTTACDKFEGFTIEGVVERPLTRICDERGWLMEVLRSDDPTYPNFGQMYITTSYPGVIKGWHYHKLQWDFITSIGGMIKVVLYDGRSDSLTYGKVQEFFVGPDNPLLIGIPPMVYHGWKSYTETAYVVSCPTELYNREEPDEYRLEPYTRQIPYDWSRVDR